MKFVHGSRKEHQLDVGVLTRKQRYDRHRPATTQQNKIAARTGEELFHR
jgi:hypothetical protein